MQKYEKFIGIIIAEPANWENRLVLADKLEEDGDYRGPLLREATTWLTGALQTVVEPIQNAEAFECNLDEFSPRQAKLFHLACHRQCLRPVCFRQAVVELSTSHLAPCGMIRHIVGDSANRVDFAMNNWNYLLMQPFSPDILNQLRYEFLRNPSRGSEARWNIISWQVWAWHAARKLTP